MSNTRKCRECGCTQERACVTAEGPCHWVAEDLCSACAPVGGNPLITGEDLVALRRLPAVRVELEAGSAFSLLAVLQLALRHPGFKASHGDAYKFANDLAHSLQEYLSVTPNLERLCEAGWDPEHDVPAAGPGPSSIILPP